MYLIAASSLASTLVWRRGSDSPRIILSGVS